MFLGYSIGSLNETQSHLTVAYDRGYIDKTVYERLFRQGTGLRKQIIAFIGSLVRVGSGVKNMRRVKSWSEEVWEMFERTTGQERPGVFRTPREDARPRIADRVPE